MKLTRRSMLLLFVFLIPMIESYGGFDGGPSCSPKLSRRGRAQILATIPCDLSLQTYCNLPGNQYPWHAVRRFVHENQGLMRRMYGDVRHISILRTEINNNDIDFDDVLKTAARYSRSGWKKNKYLYSDLQNSRGNNDVLSEPYFRPASTTTKAPATSATENITKMSAATNSKAEENTTKTTLNPDRLKVIPLESTLLTDEVQTIFDNVTISATTANDEPIKIVQSPDLSLKKNKTESATISTTLRIFLPIKVGSDKGGSEITAPPSDDADVQEIETTTIKSANDQEESNATTLHDQPEENNQNEEKADEEETNEQIDSNEITSKQANIRPPQQQPPPEQMEGQLFQDAADKKPPAFDNRGVNACPVKEEVVAPFWANNTRGEVLALLNLYPFEQYVHWEKCTSEHKQMYCRDGCRCEQQYRLHRLLAYDPHNECRGIFSDWFRFPSCCICKCYDVPMEYRMTSRSPRAMDKQPADLLDAAYDDVQRAMYEYANDDWYRSPPSAQPTIIDDDINMDLEYV